MSSFLLPANVSYNLFTLHLAYQWNLSAIVLTYMRVDIPGACRGPRKNFKPSTNSADTEETSVKVLQALQQHSESLNHHRSQYFPGFPVRGWNFTAELLRCIQGQLGLCIVYKATQKCCKLLLHNISALTLVTANMSHFF